MLRQKYYSKSALGELNMSVSYLFSQIISHLCRALPEFQHSKSVTFPKIYPKPLLVPKADLVSKNAFRKIDRFVHYLSFATLISPVALVGGILFQKPCIFFLAEYEDTSAQGTHYDINKITL